MQASLNYRLGGHHTSGWQEEYLVMGMPGDRMEILFGFPKAKQTLYRTVNAAGITLEREAARALAHAILKSIEEDQFTRFQVQDSQVSGLHLKQSFVTDSGTVTAAPTQENGKAPQ